MLTSWGQVATLRYGRALPDGAAPTGPAVVFGTNGPTGRTTDAVMGQGPAVIIGRKGAYRGVHLAGGPYWVIDTAFVLEPSQQVNPAWAYYSLVATEINSLDSGSAIPSLSREDFYAIPLNLPPLPEQQAIAEVLGALDDKIAVNARITKTSREMVSALFATAVAQGANVQPLPSELRITFGEPFSGRYFTMPGVGRPVLRIRDIRRGRSDVWTRESRPNETLVQAGQVVAGMDAEFEPAIWLGETSLLNQRVCLVESSQFGNAFAREMAAPAMAQIENEKSGTTVIHMNKSDLERVSVTVPTGPQARALAEQANCVLRLVVALARESQTLAELRDTLLPALMDGTMRVKDAVEKVGDVL